MRPRALPLGISLTAALLAATTPTVLAEYAVTLHTIAGGGVTQISGGTFALGGTIGQPVANRLTGMDFILGGGFWFGGTTPVSGVEPPTEAPRAWRINPASPNPVIARTLVSFELPASTPVQASLYDASGRHVRTLVDGILPAGLHERGWDRRDDSGRMVTSGIYFLRIDAGVHRDCQKLVVLR